jgi:hypothetical protein
MDAGNFVADVRLDDSDEVRLARHVEVLQARVIRLVRCSTMQVHSKRSCLNAKGVALLALLVLTSLVACNCRSSSCPSSRTSSRSCCSQRSARWRCWEHQSFPPATTHWTSSCKVLGSSLARTQHAGSRWVSLAQGVVAEHTAHRRTFTMLNRLRH